MGVSSSFKKLWFTLGTNSAASAQLSGTFQDSLRRFRGTNTGGSGFNLVARGVNSGGFGSNLVNRGVV